MSGPKTELPVIQRPAAAAGGLTLAGGKWPSLMIRAGVNAQERFLEFFAATIRNVNTREAYFRAVLRFLHWADGCDLDLNHHPPHPCCQLHRNVRQSPAGRRLAFFASDY